MKRPNREDYIDKISIYQLIADLEQYIDYLEGKKEFKQKKQQPWNAHNVEKQSHILICKWCHSRTTKKHTQSHQQSH